MEPIEIDGGGCSHCGGRAVTSRREFLTAAAASAVTAALLTACGGGAPGAATISGPVSLTVQVSSYPALANVGGIVRIDSAGTPVAVVRTGADTFASFSLICPHFGCTVGINGGAFLCPCHGARFSSSGTWTGGQRTSNLRALTTSYDSATGVVTVNS
jgi:Rieske Fe-S protein